MNVTIMKKLIFSTLLLFLPMVIWAQDIETTDTEVEVEVETTDPFSAPPSPGRLRIAIHGGYGYRLGELPQGISEDELQYLKKMKRGPWVGGDVSWFFTSQIGAGLRASNMRVKASAYGTATYEDGSQKSGLISSQADIFFIGPQFTTRLISKSGRGYMIMNASMGYARISETERVIDETVKLTGGTLGYAFDLGYDFRVAPGLWLGVQGSMVSGSVGAVKIKNGSVNETRVLEQDQRESLLQLSLSGGIRFNF